MKRTENDYTTIKDASRFLEVPVQRVVALIKTDQIFGVCTGEETGFVLVEDVLHLVEQKHR